MCKKKDKTKRIKQADGIKENNGVFSTFEKRKTFSGMGIAIFIVVLILLLSFAALATIGFIYWRCPKYFAAGAEATLLATGLSIIGIAISVWTGLNIVNAIQKSDIDSLKETVSTLHRETIAMTDCIGDAEKVWNNTERIANEVSKASEGWSSMQRLALRSAFFQELRKTSIDAMSAKLYAEFQAQDTIEINWEKLLEIEWQFSAVYEMHSGLVVSNEALHSAAMAGIKAIHAYDKPQSALVEKYLLFRESEFNFYKGYVESLEKSFWSFRAAIIGYEKLWNIELEGITTSTEEICDKKRELAVYFANSLGEANSKILQQYSLLKECLRNDNIAINFIETCKTKAIQYGECAVAWKNGTVYAKKEVIFRNLGCSYEGLDKANKKLLEHEQDIFKNYQQAFKLMANDNNIKPGRMESVYHVLLTYYMRYMEAKTNLQKETKIRILDNGSKQEYVMITIDNGVCDEHTCIRCQEFIRYADFAQTDGKKNHFLIVMHGFAYFFAGILIKNGKCNIPELNFEICKAKVQLSIDDLDLLGCDDYYSKVLKAENTFLKKYA